MVIALYLALLSSLIPVIDGACHYTCNKCFGLFAPSLCFTCGTNSVTHRTLVSTSCPCDAGYYDAGVTNCAKLNCVYSCATCVNTVSQCSSCTASAQRELSGTNCVCKVGYYDDGSNELCATCHYSCYRCTSSSTTCTQCSGSNFRQLSGSTCPCINGYYEAGAATCAKCNYKCATCTGTSTNCQTCAGSNRNAPAACDCGMRLYDDGVSASCQSCHHSCQTCTNATVCVTCDGTKHRLAATNSQTCICNNEYFDDGSNELCQDCDTSCLSCDAATSSDCLSCNTTSFRVFSSGTGNCLCKDGYFAVDTATQLCSICDSTCKTCATSATTCTSCDASKQRESDGSTSCICSDGYYEDPSKLCQGCHLSCATCTDGTSCATCITAQNTTKNAVSGICDCANTSVWNSLTSHCDACNYRCQTCDTLTTNCTSCPAGSSRSYISNTCDCIQYYYDDGSNANCVSCPYTCATCDASGCLTCDSTKHRHKSGTSCLCDDGYFNDGTNQLCLPCQSSCRTCTNGSECAACNSSLFRQLSGTTKLCQCQPYYYQTSLEVCQPCKYNCFSCGNNLQCLTCDAAKFRQLESTTVNCVCMDRYFDDGGNALCQSCLYDCFRCTGPSQCTQCDPTLHRQLTTDKRCQCIDGYQQTSQLCQLCHYSCLTCTTGASTACETCDSTKNRIKNAVTSQCLCKDGYYDGGAHECVLCHYSCEKCVNGAGCTECDTGIGRTRNTFCDCPTEHFYDDGSTQPCHDCHYTCLTCAQANLCATCDATKFRKIDGNNIFCECMDGYYDDTLNNQLCRTCSYTCTTCQDSLACLTCNTTAFRHQPGDLCPCIEKYFDTGNDEQLCQSCDYSCETCTNLTQCQTCDINRHRIYNQVTKLCGCETGYFDDGTNEECGVCQFSCDACENNSYVCLECNATANRQLSTSTNKCLCEDRYFDDLVNEQCLNCHYSCKSCSDNSTCDTCDPLLLRQADPTNDLCKCMIKYFDDGFSNQTCVRCQLSCLQCVDLTACTDCETALFREVNGTTDYAGNVNPFCPCFYRYYSPDPQAACLPCHYSCEVCSGPNSTNCLFCNASAHRTLTTDECLCNDNYYDNGVIEKCLECNVACLICTGPLTTQCTQCATTHYLFLNMTTCFDVCPDHHFGRNSSMTCQVCAYQCITCVNETKCTKCEPGFPLYRDECYDSCPVQSTFYQVADNICVDCPPTCLTCNSLTVCTSCIDDYYLDLQLTQCFACHQHCKGCFGPAENQCQDCQYPLYFKNNQCFNITCPYGQYIHSHQGCLNCSSLFSNSLTCNITNATLCQALYKVENGVCVHCDSVSGYKITSSGDCSEVCGDGVLYDYQCDDANTDDGDGCSANCLIEAGWNCNNTATVSVCQLDGGLSMTLSSFFKYGGQNKIKVTVSLSIPVQLANRFTLQIIGIDDSLYDWTFTQLSNLITLEFIIDYRADISKKSINLLYSSSRRLLTTFSVSLSQTFVIDAYPPAVYYQSSTISQFTSFKSIIYALSIVLLVECLCLIPHKIHLHSVTLAWIPAQIYIGYGVLPEAMTDWIKWSLKDLSPLSFIGGFWIGDCCETSDFLNYTTKITQNAGIAVLVSVGIWLIYGIFYFIHSYCCSMTKCLLYFRYFSLTLQLILLYHLSFSGLNALSHSSLVSQIGALNVCNSIFINIFIIALLVALWALTYLLPISQDEENSEKADATIHSENALKLSVTGTSFYEFDLKPRASKDPLRISEGTEENKSEDQNTDNEPLPMKQKKKQLKYGDEWLVFDYVELYKPKKYAKYFLPIFITKIWISLIMMAFLYNNILYLFCVLCFLDVFHAILTIVQRPFLSWFTNFRIVFMDLMFIALDALMIYYIVQANASLYSNQTEKIALIFMIIILISAVVFMLVEHFYSWREQLWSILEPCLISLRLRGRRKVVPLEKKRRVERLEVEQIKMEEKPEEEMDAFYARMIKKENLERQFRKERHMRGPKINHSMQ